MCLLAFAWHHHPDWPLIFIGNRDEFHARPAASADWWDDRPRILAGRDLQSGGSWLGVSRDGRFAVVTNYRHPDDREPRDRSRGELVVQALDADVDRWPLPAGTTLADYAGFNLIYGTRDRLHWLSNRRDGVDGHEVADETGEVVDIDPGIHGLSNHLLDTPWPKVQRVTGRLADELAITPRPDDETLFAILADDERAADHTLPDTGVGLELERFLSSPFIRSERYGTRASTVVAMRADGHIEFAERRFNAAGEVTGTDSFTFEAQPA